MRSQGFSRDFLHAATAARREAARVDAYSRSSSSTRRRACRAAVSADMGSTGQPVAARDTSFSATTRSILALEKTPARVSNILDDAPVEVLQTDLDSGHNRVPQAIAALDALCNFYILSSSARSRRSPAALRRPTEELVLLATSRDLTRISEPLWGSDTIRGAAGCTANASEVSW